MMTYLHKTQGRIRVRSAYILNHPVTIQKQLQALQKTAGVTGVIYRKYSGSITILFEARQVSDAAIQAQLEAYNWIEKGKKADFVSQVVQKSAEKMLKGVVIGSVKRVVGAPAAFILAAALSR